VGQIYRPHGPSRGTVIFLHGLSDHLGTNLHGIIACLKENYTFAAFDLPGHGLSSGMRGGIGDFSEYARSLHLFLQSCDSLINFPLVFIGHSTVVLLRSNM
jgi:alpha-beta hydrolase superfamily lysophospholipase